MILFCEPAQCLFWWFFCYSSHQVQLKNKPYLRWTSCIGNSIVLWPLRPTAEHRTWLNRINQTCTMYCSVSQIVFDHRITQVWVEIALLFHNTVQSPGYPLKNTRALIWHQPGQCDSLQSFLIYYSCHRQTILLWWCLITWPALRHKIL